MTQVKINCTRILMPLQLTTFENIVSKEEITQNEQSFLLPQSVLFIKLEGLVYTAYNYKSQL